MCQYKCTIVRVFWGRDHIHTLSLSHGPNVFSTSLADRAAAFSAIGYAR